MLDIMENYIKYLNISKIEHDWGFCVNTVGCADIGPANDYPNQRQHPKDHAFSWDTGRILDGYYIVFITKGKGVLESARTRAREIHAGTCFILFPGVWHRYKPHPEHGWEEYWVGFKGSYPDQLMGNGIFSPDRPFIEVGMNDELLQLFHLLIQHVKSSVMGYRQVITGITLQMLGLLNTWALYGDQSIDHHTKLISKAKFLLQESIGNPINMEALVKELPMGYSKFRKIFKQVTGISPNQYHLDIRIDKAKELLMSTALSVNEIAYNTGFGSIFYFSRMFKQKNGCSPKEFRETKRLKR